MRSLLQRFKEKNPHRVLFTSSGPKYTWISYRQDDGTLGLLAGYSRRRDAVRALRQEGYKQHGSSWSLPSTNQETTPTHPEKTVKVIQSGHETIEAPWPFE